MAVPVWQINARPIVLRDFAKLRETEGGWRGGWLQRRGRIFLLVRCRHHAFSSHPTFTATSVSAASITAVVVVVAASAETPFLPPPPAPPAQRRRRHYHSRLLRRQRHQRRAATATAATPPHTTPPHTPHFTGPIYSDTALFWSLYPLNWIF
jgi:hypothetical protein